MPASLLRSWRQRWGSCRACASTTQKGVLGAFQARAIKGVIAWQLARTMKERKLCQTRLATTIHTSRSQVDRVLDPNDGTVTIETLQGAAAVAGRRVQLGLV